MREHARGLGASTVVANTTADNAAAIAALRRLGADIDSGSTTGDVHASLLQGESCSVCCVATTGGKGRAVLTAYTTRQLCAETWDAFAELVERNNGIFGGCWCMGGYPEGLSRTDPEENRIRKHRRVRDGAAHAALVFDDQGRAQGWCQYGDPQELARVKHRRAYDQDPPPRPDWRIQCVYVDPRHRGQGIARVALLGALEQIAHHGGGRVEAISEVTTGRTAHGRFLFSATVELFEQLGFESGRKLGKHAYLVSRNLPPAPTD